jgi:hypothetical protein
MSIDKRENLLYSPLIVISVLDMHCGAVRVPNAQRGGSMKVSNWTARLAVAFTFTAAHGHVVYAQAGIDPERLAGLSTRLSQVNSVLDTFPDAQKETLSSGAQNLLTLAQGWNRIEKDLEKAKAALKQNRAQPWAADEDAYEPAAFLSRVSNPSIDFVLSIMAGFTQSETSTAWCGNNVVVGFNDSGSFYESLLFGPGGASFSGAAVSTDSGRSFRDVGHVNAGLSPFNFLGGDPVVTCTVTPSASDRAAAITFYYSQIFETGSPAAPIAAVALSRSIDGGANWEEPIAAAQKDGFTHFLDKPWSAADPASPGNIYLTYTDFDSSGAVCGRSISGAPISRTAIEIVHSTDGGATWAAPAVITESCLAAPSFLSVQGSQVLVDSAGTVYVAWECFAPGPSRALWICKSTDHGSSFGSAVKIDNVTATGNGSRLQGGFRTNEFPMLAIDRNSGPLYVTWNDGRSFALPDAAGLDGTYHYADILISRSLDGGATWSPAVRVNGDPLTHFFRGQSRGTDHYMPGVAVDRTGAVGVCWYDRRADPANLASNRFCSVSRDGGITWINNLLVPPNSQPWHATDTLTNPFYLGDYDVVASDFAMTNPGFIGAYASVNLSAFVPNQDVLSISFP